MTELGAGGHRFLSPAVLWGGEEHRRHWAHIPVPHWLPALPLWWKHCSHIVEHLPAERPTRCLIKTMKAAEQTSTPKTILGFPAQTCLLWTQQGTRRESESSPGAPRLPHGPAEDRGQLHQADGHRRSYLLWVLQAPHESQSVRAPWARWARRPPRGLAWSRHAWEGSPQPHSGQRQAHQCGWHLRPLLSPFRRGWGGASCPPYPVTSLWV